MQTLNKFKPSHYQQSIFNFVTEGRGDAVVNAVAGSGKTLTLVEASKLLRSDRALFLAFNKHIATELETRLGGTMAAKTIHSIGVECLRSYLPRITVDEGKIGDISKPYAIEISNHLEKRYQIQLKTWYRNPVGEAPESPPNFGVVIGLFKKIVHFTRVTLTDVKDKAAVEAVCDRFNCIDDELVPFDTLYTYLPAILKECQRFAEQGIIDYDDMLWLPHVWGLQPSKYEWIFVDECLPYKSPVLLADGTSIQIGDIVEQKLPVSVLAYDTATGKQKSCKVTGWSKTPNRKPLVKIKVQYARKYPSGTLADTNFVVCTVDHKVWADDQWIHAGDVKPGMIMQVETSAQKSQAYKITTAGRSVVSATMTSKNAAKTPAKRLNKGFPIKQRGGNGQGLTIPQQMMLEKLGSNWSSEYAIPTKVKRGNGYPTNYKVDLANLQFKIAVELDGQSHRNPTRRNLDKKKDDFLLALGWKVIRIPNVEAVQKIDDWADTLKSLTKCTDGDCPVNAKVVSVEPVNIPDYFVYDITVEDCHNFYANGILVHNCQDLSAAQLDLVLKLRAPGGRMLWVGDRKQAIYGFAGSDSESFDRIIERTCATVLPLSICYRCPATHIKLAQAIVAEIEAKENAIEGIVEDVKPSLLPEMIKEGDLIISRCTAPVVKLCIELIAKRIPARVRGRDIGRALTTIVREVAKHPEFSFDKFGYYLEEYADIKLNKLKQKRNSEAQIESIRDRIQGISVCYEAFNAKSLGDLQREIEALFSDSRSSVVLSTVHRAKGLENERVFILEPDKLPLRWIGQQAWQLSQEQNIKYIALTRAKSALYFIK